MPGLEVAEVRQAEWGAQVFAELDPVFFGDGEEDFDYFGVELSAGTAADFFAGVGERAALCGRGGR